MRVILKLPDRCAHEINFSSHAPLPVNQTFLLQRDRSKTACCTHCCHEAPCPVILQLTPLCLFLRDIPPHDEVELTLIDQTMQRTAAHRLHVHGAALQLLPLFLQHARCPSFQHGPEDHFQRPDQIIESWILTISQSSRPGLPSDDPLSVNLTLDAMQANYEQLIGALSHILERLYSTPGGDVFIHAAGVCIMMLRMQAEESTVYLQSQLNQEKKQQVH